MRIIVRMRKPLTSKQKSVLSTIVDLTHKNGTPPKLEELRAVLGLSGLSSVQRHTDALKEKGYLDNTRGLSIPDATENIQIPLVGNAPCGQPLLAVENIEAYVSYPRSKISGNHKDYFFLRGIGDSMNASNINGKSIDNGDYVLVKKQSLADPGNKIVALLGDNATIKKYIPEQNVIKLMPESTNPANKPILSFEDIIIQGVVVDVVKKGGQNG